MRSPEFVRVPLLRHPSMDRGWSRPPDPPEPPASVPSPPTTEPAPAHAVLTDEMAHGLRHVIAANFKFKVDEAVARLRTSVDAHLHSIARGSGHTAGYFRHVYNDEHFQMVASMVSYLAAYYGTTEQWFLEPHN